MENYPFEVVLEHMREADIDSEIIYAIEENCKRYEIIRRLLDLWMQETDPEERREIVLEIYENLDEMVP